MMRIYSIRERPEYIPWPCWKAWKTIGRPVCRGFRSTWSRCARPDAPLPDAYIAVEKGKVVGGYTLAVKEILWSEDKGLWVATLYVDPAFRGRHLSPVLLAHARRQGGRLGFEKIYLATEHSNYYEKYGFFPIGPDACAWGEPTRMFENTTLPPKVRRIA